MEAYTVQVESRIAGRKHEPGIGAITLELFEERLTVRELIASAVEEQVRDLITIRHMEAAEARRMLDRQYLTDDEVRDQISQRGAVIAPTREVKIPRINVAAEVEKAQRSFERGSFMILVDGQQVDSLNEEVTLKLNSKVTFLRMTPLVGG